MCTESLLDMTTRQREAHVLAQHWTVRGGRVAGIDEYVIATESTA